MQHSRTRRLVLRLGARRPGSLTCAVPRGGHVRLCGAGGARGAPACPQNVLGSFPRAPGPSRSSGRPQLAADRDGGHVVATSEGRACAAKGLDQRVRWVMHSSGGSRGTVEMGRCAGGGSGAPGRPLRGGVEKRGDEGLLESSGALSEGASLRFLSGLFYTVGLGVLTVTIARTSRSTPLPIHQLEERSKTPRWATPR